MENNEKQKGRGKQYLMLLLLLLLIPVLSCDNPYYGIGEGLDNSEPIVPEGEGGIPYLRTLNEGRGIEALILEHDILSGDGSGAMTLIRVEDSDGGISAPPRTDVTLVQGSYIAAGVNISFELNRKYSLYFQSTGGGIVTDNPQSETAVSKRIPYYDLSLSAPEEKEISFGGTTWRRMDRIVDALMAETDESLRASNLQKLYQISGIWGPQCRIPGFGSPDMLQYTTPADFSSLMHTDEGDNIMTLSFRQTLRAVATFNYRDHTDLKPIMVNGTYVSDSDMRGSGPLTGTVDFSLEGSEQTWECRLDYNDIRVKYTVPESGTYLMSVDGGSAVSIPYDNLLPGALDFSTIPQLP